MMAALSANVIGLNEICIQIVILMFFRGAKIIGIYIHSRTLCRDSGERKCLRLSLHNIQQFIGNGLQAALKIFKIFTKATTPKEADPFTMMAGIRSAELLDMLNNFTEVEDSKLV